LPWAIKQKGEPLWWLNPNNYVYSELNVPRHMKLPKVVLPDGDGDGVTDQFDLEPNTPKGCPVDSHGVTKDTDGDGVPDCRDKEDPDTAEMLPCKQ
jgi:OOP family OmpA-OmpF porin